MPDGLSKDLVKFCQWYEDEIKKAGGIDLQLLGIGRDGHWAFNEPGPSLPSRIRIKPLTKQTINDNYERFYKKAKIEKKQMPHFAITMGIGTIIEARHLLMIASGKVTVVLDEDAASELKNIEYCRYAEKLKLDYRFGHDKLR